MFVTDGTEAKGSHENYLIEKNWFRYCINNDDDDDDDTKRHSGFKTNLRQGFSSFREKVSVRIIVFVISIVGPQVDASSASLHVLPWTW